MNRLWWAGEKLVSEIDMERILTHISGCLYYYGAMSGRDLYECLREYGEMDMPYAKFSQLIRAFGNDLDSKYPFMYQDKVYSYLGVENPARVIDGHQSRTEIPFRPVTLEVGQAVVEGMDSQ